jgi:hypothetical protein
MQLLQKAKTTEIEFEENSEKKNFLVILGAAVTKPLMEAVGAQGIPHCFVFAKTGFIFNSTICVILCVVFHRGSGAALSSNGFKNKQILELLYIISLFLFCQEPEFEKEIERQCGKVSSFGGEAHSLGAASSNSVSEADASLPAHAPKVDETTKTVKIAIRSPKGQSAQFVRKSVCFAFCFKNVQVLNDVHTIGDLKRCVIDKGLAAAAPAFDLVQSHPKKTCHNNDLLGPLNGSALTIVPK